MRMSLQRGLLCSLMCIGMGVTAQQSYTRDLYIETFAPIAVREMHQHGIPASITLSQAILESGDGNSELARRANNHFGIKCGGSWDGPSVRHDDDARNECFRKYRDAEESFTDHSLFLAGGRRYQFLFDLGSRDYKKWAKGLQKAGYATHPSYASRLIDLIERHELHRFDGWTAAEVQVPNAGGEVELPEGANGLPFVKVEEGMSWEAVSERAGVPVKRLMKRNELRYDQDLLQLDRIYVKAVRCRGDQKYHVVRDGENMFSIAHQHGMKVRRLYYLNRMRPGHQPETGQKLHLKWRVRRP